MRNADVFQDNELVYSTSGIRCIGRVLLINRLDPGPHRVISSRGPHFAVLTPLAQFNSDQREGWFEATGIGLLGSVSYVGGIASREGAYSYSVAELNATYLYDKKGLALNMRVGLGGPIVSSHGPWPARPAPANSYSITYASYFEFWSMHDRIVRAKVRDEIVKNFGKAAAKAMTVD